MDVIADPFCPSFAGLPNVAFSLKAHQREEHPPPFFLRTADDQAARALNDRGHRRLKVSPHAGRLFPHLAENENFLPSRWAHDNRVHRCSAGFLAGYHPFTRDGVGRHTGHFGDPRDP